MEYFDGSRWVTALSGASVEWKLNDSTKERQSVSFPTVNAYKLRLKVNDGNRIWGNIALNELIVEHTADNVPVTGIIMDKLELVFNSSSGRSRELHATVMPDHATNKNITWSTNLEQVATVDDHGIVTAVEEGGCYHGNDGRRQFSGLQPYYGGLDSAGDHDTSSCNIRI